MDLLLTLDHSNNKRVDCIKSSFRVRVRATFLSVNKLISSVEKLGYVSAKVMTQVELATRMDLVKTIEIKHEIIEDYK